MDDTEIRAKLWALCDGTTDEDMWIQVETEDLKQMGFSHSAIKNDKTAWVHVSKVRELVLRNARHHMFDNYGQNPKS